MKSKCKMAFWITVLLAGCYRNSRKFDATGTFEAIEVIVSSETNGRILSLNIEEGDTVSKNKIVGSIDSENISLQKQQVEESIKALKQKTADPDPQVRLLQDQEAVQRSQLDNLQHEHARVERLLKEDAATRKQLDDMDAQIDMVKKQIAVTQQQVNVQRSNISVQNRGILSEGKPLQKRVEQLNDQLEKADIFNPINGTVITKYAEAGEVTGVGKALYKIADLSVITLRAYITGDQLSELKLGQAVKVFADHGAGQYKEYPGVVTWISDKAEFTPKTIQTKEERANLVYAVKIKLKNDGFLKIGMYGEIMFK